MNVSILNNTDYVDKFKEIVNTAILQYRGLSNILVWEYLKRKIKEFSVNYSVEVCSEIKTWQKQREAVRKKSKWSGPNSSKEQKSRQVNRKGKNEIWTEWNIHSES